MDMGRSIFCERSDFRERESLVDKDQKPLRSPSPGGIRNEDIDFPWQHGQPVVAQVFATQGWTRQPWTAHTGIAPDLWS
jgi:hypothetical protein